MILNISMKETIYQCIDQLPSVYLQKSQTKQWNLCALSLRGISKLVQFPCYKEHVRRIALFKEIGFPKSAKTYKDDDVKLGRLSCRIYESVYKV